MIGKTLGHYRILEKIGAGGMGEVYRAEDLHLARDVAIKVLPAGTLMDEQARRRFRKEALALSKLNHPNIQTVHDFDTQQEVDFLVVELVPGPTLAEKLGAGALPEKEIASLGLQIAAALEEAHERGVVHRDLKPQNIKVTPKNQVKVLDFGLAQIVAAAVGPGFSQGTATTDSFTETHAAAGTLPYMAPEQLRGEGVDHRTDIWAAGVVLYEMATGRRPFDAKLATALAADIQHKSTAPPRQLNPQLSSRLEEVILKCLEKELENRYQSAKELLVDLRRLSAPAALLAQRGKTRTRPRRAAAKGIKAMAVLPLENLSRDPQEDYFADGMTEALITDLSKISALRVISRTSTMRYKGTDKSVPEIARELNVDGILEGSVLRAGERVRITAQLIYAATDEHLWAERYERDLRDILSLQSEVAQAIAQEIKIKLTPQERARLGRVYRVDTEAHEAYLKGRYYWNKRTQDGLKKGIEYFEQAIKKDPDYALAYAGLAACYLQLGFYSGVPGDEAMAGAKAAALKALELDDTLAEAHSVSAAISHEYDWDWKRAKTQYSRAIELNPSYATAHQWYSEYLAAMGEHNESLAEANQAQQLDPLSLSINTDFGWAFYVARQYKDVSRSPWKKLGDLRASMVHTLHLLRLPSSSFPEPRLASCTRRCDAGESAPRPATQRAA